MTNLTEQADVSKSDFKVGDKLVAKDYSLSDELFEIKSFGRNGEIYDDHWRMLHIDQFRYATIAERKAGHRLPEPVMLFVDDADIYLERAKAAQGEIS